MWRVFSRLTTLMCTCNAPLKDLFFCSKCEMLNTVTIKSPFFLFELEESFFVDPTVLHERYLFLQNKLHPDRFAYGSKERELAQDYSGQVNLAYQILKNPFQRAEILLKDYEGSFDQKDLLDQMAKREYLETLSSQDDLSLFEKKTKGEKEAVEKEMTIGFQEKNYKKAKNSLMRLTYLNRLIIEIRRKQNNG